MQLTCCAIPIVSFHVPVFVFYLNAASGLICISFTIAKPGIRIRFLPVDLRSSNSSSSSSSSSFSFAPNPEQTLLSPLTFFQISPCSCADKNPAVGDAIPYERETMFAIASARASVAVYVSTPYAGCPDTKGFPGTHCPLRT